MRFGLDEVVEQAPLRRHAVVVRQVLREMWDDDGDGTIDFHLEDVE